MAKYFRIVAVFGGLLLLGLSTGIASGVSTPQEFFGFQPGADRQLADYEQLTRYMAHLADVSPRVVMREVGRSALDRPMYVVFLSTEKNLARLDDLRENNRRLALDPELSGGALDAIIRDGKILLMAMLSMHSNEVAPAQALPLLAHEIVTADEGPLMDWLDDVVLMVVPTHNPDGMDMVVEHYRKYLGTPDEGSSLPGLYHHYVGHDNNRDYISLTQPESRVINSLYSLDWFPQVIVDKHQMGRTGPRYFVPEYHDPIAENIDERLWYWSDVFGSNLANDMGAAGLSGVASHWVFDEYWPGASSTSHWKGAITLLTEAASCRLASPVFVEPTELRVFGKGLAEYKKSVNMPAPWPGGWWHLSDIVRYELTSMRSLLKTAARHREDLLRFRNELCRTEVEAGRSQSPFYFIMPRGQHDQSVLGEAVAALQEHGVEVSQLNEPVVLDGRRFEAGDVVVPLAQPFRAFVKEVLEAQRYPVRHYTPGGEIIRPYDVTSWSIPLHWGLESHQIDTRSEELESKLVSLAADEVVEGSGGGGFDDAWGLALPVTHNASFHAAFVALGDGLRVARLTEEVTVDETVLPKGSSRVTGDRGRLRKLLEVLGAAPIVVHDAPSAATSPVSMPRVALVETFFHDMDAGWTRYVFDTYGVPYRRIRPAEVADEDLAGEFDVMVFPDAGKDVLTKGRRKWRGEYRPTDYPPEFTKPISKEGLQEIAQFIEGGGIVLSWRRSTALFLDGLKAEGPDGEERELELPARDVGDDLEKGGLYVPGSWLEVKLLEGHPLTLGMPPQTGVFSRGSPVFATSLPLRDTNRRVIATHPEEDVLLSGYIEGEDQIGNRPVMVWLRSGRGQLVLYGFNPQFRASTPATYKLLFNALLLPRLEE
jgi:hypothetical protein